MAHARAPGGAAQWFAVYLLSLAAFCAYIDPAWRKTGAFRWPILAGSSAIVVEQTIITLQSARGVGSHFNAATAFDGALYAVMGVGSLALLAMAPLVAMGLARHPGQRPIQGGIREAIVIGLLMTGVLTLATAGTMAVLGSHRIGAAGEGAAAWPILGGLGNPGDLRVPHFFATHAMHAVPLAAWAVARWYPLRRGTVLCIAAIYGAFVAWVFVRSFGGVTIFSRQKIQLALQN
ncbi:hypothetical protein [Acidovorax sp. SUPP3334]|uniref:hypothetical protein n=1 Tax=Acidovorax sp. SUPP3334 TaxID=2920881 RepID=UPI0023DE2B49|nr:hypothetical protein [Acidovorax sp. SUPP3334]GKT25192.1 hypothetical protein AVHM3334_17205 [Acidovorax sp. SUPP3334]